MLQPTIIQRINKSKKSDKILVLSTEQKKELDSRIASFHEDRSIGHAWDEIKREILK